MKILVPKSIGASITSAVVREPSITGFSRLETSPVSPKLDQGLQAMIADPLWMLARQWQFDEFQGNDAGTPLTTSFTVQGLPVTGLKPGRDKTLAWLSDAKGRLAAGRSAGRIRTCAVSASAPQRRGGTACAAHGERGDAAGPRRSARQELRAHRDGT